MIDSRFPSQAPTGVIGAHTPTTVSIQSGPNVIGRDIERFPGCWVVKVACRSRTVGQASRLDFGLSVVQLFIVG